MQAGEWWLLVLLFHAQKEEQKCEIKLAAGGQGIVLLTSEFGKNVL